MKSNSKVISWILILMSLRPFAPDKVQAVNVTLPNVLIRGSVGGEALLSVCYVSFSLDTPVIKWQLQREKSVTVVQSIGTEIIGSLRPEYRDRILVFQNGTLLLHNLRLSDEGVYDVTVSITDDTFTGEGSIMLTVDEQVSKPQIHIDTSSVLERSENIILNCTHDNGTRTSYKWFKGGKPITNETRFVLSPDQKLLTIPRVMMADDDFYSCAVENSVGNMSSLPIRLSVYRRSSLYIILSTGGIFILITLVTVCACWTPTKKPKHLKRQPLVKIYDAHSPTGQSDGILKTDEKRKNAVTSLYILQQKSPSDSSSNSPRSCSEARDPQYYARAPHYNDTLTRLTGHPAYSSNRCT